MKIEYSQAGVKNIICDNWREFFAAFKNWHAKNKGVIPSEHYRNEKYFDLYVGFEGEGFGDFWPRNEKGEIWTSNKNDKEICAAETVLGTYHKVGHPVNELASLVLNLHGRSYNNDFKKQEEKAGKILRKIWTTGEAKNYQNLDLNWPVNTNQPNSSSSPPPPKELKNNLWIGGTVAFISLSLAVVWLFLKKLKWP